MPDNPQDGDSTIAGEMDGKYSPEHLEEAEKDPTVMATEAMNLKGILARMRDGDISADTNATGAESDKGTHSPDGSGYDFTTVSRDTGLLVFNFLVQETGESNGGSYVVLTSNVPDADRNAPATGDDHWREEVADTTVAADGSDQSDFDRSCRAAAVGVQDDGGGSSAFTIWLQGRP